MVFIAFKKNTLTLLDEFEKGILTWSQKKNRNLVIKNNDEEEVNEWRQFEKAIWFRLHRCYSTEKKTYKNGHGLNGARDVLKGMRKLEYFGSEFC